MLLSTKPLQLANACHLATVSLPVRPFLSVLTMSEFKVQLTGTPPHNRLIIKRHFTFET